MRRICELCNTINDSLPGECSFCARGDHLFGKVRLRRSVMDLYGYSEWPEGPSYKKGWVA